MISLLFDDELSPFSIKPAVWDPATVLGTDLTNDWWAVDHGTGNMTDDGAGLISNWIDRVGGRAITAVTTARPTWTATALGGTLPGLIFDSTTDCMVTTTLTGIPTGATAGEIWVLASQDAAPADTTQRTVVGYGSASAAQDRRVARSVSGASNRFRINNTQTNTDFGPDFSGVCIGWGFWKGTDQSANLNGGTLVNATVATLATATTRLRIGANNAASAAQFWHGVVNRVLITVELTAARRQQMEGYLAWYGGIQSKLPSNHPFKLGPP